MEREEGEEREREIKQKIGFKLVLGFWGKSRITAVLVASNG